MSKIIGIDLGTTNSCVAVMEGGKPTVIANAEGVRTTPSVVAFTKTGERLVGEPAKRQAVTNADRTIASIKRHMGTDYKVDIDGKKYTPQEISAMILQKLKADAESYLGETVSEAVITVPAYFYSKEREATIRAAETAGLKVKKIIDEPNAAAMAYGLNHWRENANILVYDLGGGTFDVTLVHMGKNGILSTITTRGNHKLGGRDWDARVEDILVVRFESETGLDIRGDRELLSIVSGMSEGVKKQLSAQNMQATKVSASFPGYGKATVAITKAEFEENTADLLDRTGALCLAVLEEAGLSQKNVTDILLVGGSTRMPQVPAYLQRLFNKRPLSHVNPDEAVALGAAIQSSKENEAYAALSVQVVNGKKTTDRTKNGLSSHVSVRAERKLSSPSMLTLRETTAHAMGVIAINDEGNHYYNEIIIPANHPRPVRAAKKFRFYTSPRTANELAIYVLQGDSENPLDCQITYKYVVTGIKHINRGEKIGTVIRIQYSYDVNGVIHIQARQEDSTVDLPIRRENVPADISKFGQPVTSEITEQGFNVGLQLGIRSSQNLVHKYKAVTFSNVEWIKYDNIQTHPSGAEFNEPTVHVIASEESIEFHGYNISEMNEGVRYVIDPSDDFEIECDINTSTISPHPGGYLEISLGLISAHLTENGGDILMDGVSVATVAPRFHLKMSLTNGGQYEVEIDRRAVGSKFKASKTDVDVRFGFVHESHYCHLLSHAYISDISMMQAVGQEGDDNPDTETWDD